MLRILLICASICVLVQSRSPPMRCRFFGSGVVCDDNLRGFYKCDGKDPFGKYNPCGADEICSCGKNRPCPKNRPVCISRPKFTLNEVPKDFTVSYNGQMNISSPGGHFVRTVAGSIRQSAAQGRELLMDTTTFREKKTGKFIKRIIKITKRISSFKTVQYTYHKFPNTDKPGFSEGCHTVVKRDFVEFFNDLRKYSYKDLEHPHQYFYRDGPAHPQASYTLKKWKLGSTHNTQSNVPVQYSKYVENGPTAKTTERLRIKFHYFFLRRPDDAYFRIPGACFRKNKRSLDSTDEIERELQEDFKSLL